MPTIKQRKSRNNKDSGKISGIPIPSKEGDVNIYKTSLAIHTGYDTNQVDSTLEFMDSLLTGKMGTRSAFTLTIVEVAPPEVDETDG